jgi:hypothetical protein
VGPIGKERAFALDLDADIVLHASRVDKVRDRLMVCGPLKGRKKELPLKRDAFQQLYGVGEIDPGARGDHAIRQNVVLHRRRHAAKREHQVKLRKFFGVNLHHFRPTTFERNFSSRPQRLGTFQAKASAAPT